MTPQNRLLCHLIAAMLLAAFLCDNTAAQRRNTRARRTRPPQTKQQPTPTPTPEPPQKTQDEIAVEEEVKMLSNLSAAEKAAVRAAVEGLDRALRLWELKGYDEKWPYRVDTALEEQRIKTVSAALQESSMMRKLITGAWKTIGDAHMAETAYINGGSVYDDILLRMIDKYKLRGIPGAQVPRRIYENAADFTSFAASLAIRAGIMQPTQ